MPEGPKFKAEGREWQGSWTGVSEPSGVRGGACICILYAAQKTALVVTNVIYFPFLISIKILVLLPFVATVALIVFFFFFSNNAHSSELSNVVHGRCA